MCSSAIMHSWLQYLAPHIAHWCPSNGKVDTQCRLQRLRVLNKSRFGLLSARVTFNHCSIAQCSCDPSCLLLQLLHTPWFDTPRTPIFVGASLTFKRTTALLSHCHHCFLGYNSIQFNLSGVKHKLRYGGELRLFCCLRSCVSGIWCSICTCLSRGEVQATSRKVQAIPRLCYFKVQSAANNRKPVNSTATAFGPV